MAAGIAITGIPSSYRAPITAAEVILGQGGSTAPTADREALYPTPMTSAGTGTVNTIVDCQTEQDAITAAGVGSRGHQAMRYHLKVNKSGKVSLLLFSASSGAGAAAATGTFTWVMASTNPTSTCDVSFTAGEEDLQMSLTTAATISTAATEMAAKINAATWLPFTASASLGVVTLTTKILGAAENAVHRIRVNKVTPGCDVTLTASATTLGSGADGAVTENANLTTALTAVEAVGKYYLAELSGVSANIATTHAHVVAKSLPTPGLRCRVFTGSVAAFSSAATLAIARNSERAHIACQPVGDHTPAQLAAWALALHQRYEATAPHHNFDNHRDGVLKPAYAESDWPDAADINDAITDGVMIIASNQAGAYLPMSVTTRSKDSTGLLDDFRATETHRISVMDLLADTLATRDIQQFAGFHLKPDTYLADGTVKPDARVGENTTTPSLYKAGLVLRVLQEFADNDWVQGIDDWVAATVVQIDPSNNGRLQVATSGRTIDQKHQVTFRLSETTSN